MSKSMGTVHLGYELGTGRPVEIPIAHTFVTGQTQLSGKTSTLRAIVERSGRRAIAFVTKRGESFDGRRIRPFLPREGEQPIHWRTVETILASAMGQRNMKYERLWIVNAAKGARSLEGVRTNVERLQAKKGKAADTYMLIGEYLDLVLPEMRALHASDTLTLDAGLNIMDLSAIGPNTQAMVIRAALEEINRKQSSVLTVFPEAWEFAPRNRAAPAKDEAIAMARKGAAIGNFLLCDSQDIAGVDTVVRQAASVWILGVQRELNELKRTIQMIPAGIKRPKPEEVATLEIGQFIACWGTHAVKTYVQPTWIDAEQARRIAMGTATITPPPAPPRPKEDEVTSQEAQALRDENATLREQVRGLSARLAQLEGKDTPNDGKAATTGQRDHGSHRTEARENRGAGQTPDRRAEAQGRGDRAPNACSVDETFDNEALYQAFKARLIEELPGDSRVMAIVVARPELQVHVERKVVQIDGETPLGRTAQLIAEGYFDDPRTAKAAWSELKRRGFKGADARIYESTANLHGKGFLTKEDGAFRAVPGMKVNIIDAAA